MLSLTGGYEPGKSGRFTRYNLPTHDIYLWQLRFGRDSPFHGYYEFIPTLFWPLLYLDRKYWHQELPMLEVNDDGEIVDSDSPPRNKMHPRLKAAERIFKAFNPRFEEARKTETRKDDDALFKEMTDELDKIW